MARQLVVALTITIASGCNAAISLSFAAESSTVERFLEVRDVEFVDDVYFIVSTGQPRVDLLVSGGEAFGLMSQQARFDAEFTIDARDAQLVRDLQGDLFTLTARLAGEFIFDSVDGARGILLDVFIRTGVAMLTGSVDEDSGMFRPISGELVISSATAVLESGEELPASAAFTLTNFLPAIDERGGPVIALASASFSGVIVPSPGAPAIAGLVFLWTIGRRRRSSLPRNPGEISLRRRSNNPHA
jgi:hypothetical protein